MYVYESISIQNSRIYVDIRPAAVIPGERRRGTLLSIYLKTVDRPAVHCAELRDVPNPFLTITNVLVAIEMRVLQLRVILCIFSGIVYLLTCVLLHRDTSNIA